MGRDEKLNAYAKHSEYNLGTTVFDRLQRPLGIGDEVLVEGLDMGRMLWKVQALEPVVDPRAPANTVRVLLLAPVALLVRAREPAVNLTRVRTARELGEPGPTPPANPVVPPPVEATGGWRQQIGKVIRRWKP